MMPGLLRDLAIEQILRAEMDCGEKFSLCCDCVKILPGSNDLVGRRVAGRMAAITSSYFFV
jgi:hypothetical protein